MFKKGVFIKYSVYRFAWQRFKSSRCCRLLYFEQFLIEQLNRLNHCFRLERTAYFLSLNRNSLRWVKFEREWTLLMSRFTRAKHVLRSFRALVSWLVQFLSWMALISSTMVGSTAFVSATIFWVGSTKSSHAFMRPRWALFEFNETIQPRMPCTIFGTWSATNLHCCISWLWVWLLLCAMDERRDDVPPSAESSPTVTNGGVYTIVHTCIAAIDWVAHDAACLAHSSSLI